MAYVKTTWQTGDVITAEKLNHAENQIEHLTPYVITSTASAGTITGLVNTDEATSDICPFGWQMPTYSQISGVTSYKTTFNPVAGGRYHKKDNDDTSNGYWWSTTAYDRDSRYNLRYNNDELGVHHLLDRDDGFYIRCVKK